MGGLLTETPEKREFFSVFWVQNFFLDPKKIVRTPRHSQKFPGNRPFWFDFQAKKALFRTEKRVFLNSLFAIFLPKKSSQMVLNRIFGPF